MSRRRLLLIVAVPLLMAACSSRSSGPPAIAEAFAGPSSLPIRQDLTLKSPVVATVKHGERLEILQTRRRFVQVRTAQGATGWTDNRQLLSTEQMQEIRRFAETTSDLPSEGAATVFEQVNVHTEPSRTSPSFLQIPENETIHVIGHKLAPRTVAAQERAAPIVKRPVRNTKKAREKAKESRRLPPPPMPAAPKPPKNWQELSRIGSRQPAGRPEYQDAQTPQKSPVMEDWSLIRTKDRQVGWVLSRMVTMSIPDEVAQYAEGHRITAYFPLSDINDDGQTKHAWVWTTISRGGQPFEFDGFRVFVWSVRHHRYETVYRERELKGFYPVEAVKAGNEKTAIATFSVVVDADGQLVRKTYAFNGYRVSLSRKEPYVGPTTQAASGSTTSLPAPQPRVPAQPWYSRMSNTVRSWFR
jgi:hypothetical protein